MECASFYECAESSKSFEVSKSQSPFTYSCLPLLGKWDFFFFGKHGCLIILSQSFWHLLIGSEKVLMEVRNGSL